jgi:hypothetical protein
MNKGNSMSDKPLALKHQNLEIGKRKVVQLPRRSRGHLLVNNTKRIFEKALFT